MSQPRNTRRLASQTRHTLRALVGTAAVAAVALVSACGDAPSAPAAPTTPVRLSKSSGGPGQSVPAKREKALGAPIVVRHRIDPNKDSKIEIKDAGFELKIPKGAVDSPVEITVTALPGQIAYEFQPHGLVFRRPLSARQDLDELGITLPKSISLSGLFASFDIPMLEVSYFADVNALSAPGPVDVQEFLGSIVDVSSNRVEFEIKHFSGYMISWGRSRSAY